jgi:hypothetical protein
MTRPNGINTNYSYDSLSRLLSVLHQSGASTIDGAGYTLDSAGNRTAKTDDYSSVTSNYTYDALYELTQVTQGSTTTESYSHDPVGTRTASLGVSSYSRMPGLDPPMREVFKPKLEGELQGKNRQMFAPTSWREVMRRYQGAVYILVMFIASIAISTHSQNGSQTITLPSLLRHEEVFALTPWSTSGADLLCVFSQSRQASQTNRESLPERRMVVYRRQGSSLTNVFETETADWFFSAYPTREGGRLLVIWGGGSAYHVNVYAYLTGKVRQVLDEGSRDVPEVSFDDEGRESILLTSPGMVDGTWKNSTGTTSVFMWNGNSYSKIGTFPWSRRFQCASGEPCLPSK